MIGHLVLYSGIGSSRLPEVNVEHVEWVNREF